jgi:threonine dehydrogenase-like Zn-dependent dehydrogenase
MMGETMKAALWVGPEAIEVKQVEKPKPGPGEALVKVAYGGIF